MDKSILKKIACIIIIFLLQQNFSKNKTSLNDFSTLNQTVVDAIVYPKTIVELQAVVKNSSGLLAIAGAQCSMGGQTLVPNGIVIDMRYVNKIVAFNPKKRTITVESGICWKDQIGRASCRERV